MAHFILCACVCVFSMLNGLNTVYKQQIALISKLYCYNAFNFLIFFSLCIESLTI